MTPNCRTCNDSGLIPAEHGIAQPCPMCDAYERRARVFGIEDDPTPPAYHAPDDDADESVGKILAAIIGILIALLIAMIAIWPQSARAQGFSENAYTAAERG